MDRLLGRSVVGRGLVIGSLRLLVVDLVILAIEIWEGFASMQ